MASNRRTLAERIANMEDSLTRVDAALTMVAKDPKYRMRAALTDDQMVIHNAIGALSNVANGLRFMKRDLDEGKLKEVR